MVNPHILEIFIKLLAVAVLIALTAFFVASEFAIVKVRSSRINQLIEEGHRNALAAKKVTTPISMSTYLPVSWGLQ